MKLVRRITALLLLALLLAGCGPALGRQQLAATAPKSITLEDGDTVGQTFAAGYDGLAGIELYIQPRTPGDGELRLHLRAGPRSTADLAAGSLAVAQIARPGFYRITFAPQPQSRGRDYYALFEFAGRGRLKLDRAAGDAYLDGALYQDGQPQDGQLTSTLVYDVPRMLLGFAGLGLIWLGVLLAGVLLYIVPGWALLAALWPAARALPWGARLGLAAGLSLALYPLLLLWTGLVGLHAGPLYAWAPAVLGLAALLWLNRARLPGRQASQVVRLTPFVLGAGRRRREEVQVLASASLDNSIAIPAAGDQPDTARRTWPRSEALWPDLALAATIALLVITRFAGASGLDTPLWGDSYHHTLITQLLVDNGGLFNSWQPYAEMQSLTYHFGFHAAAAALHWLSGLAAPQAVVWAGQLLNVLAALALYPLALRVGGSRWAGVGAVLLAGLIAPMPSYYVNWGRYTQLAGQAILPAAIYLIWAAVEEQRDTRPETRDTSDAASGLMSRVSDLVSPASWRFFILPWIALAGLGLAHYRVLIFVVFFFPALFLLQLGRQPLPRLAGRMAAVAGGAGLLFLPWFVHVFAGRILSTLAIRLSTPAAALPATTQEYNAPVDPRTVLPTLAWLLLLLAMSWGLWRRERGAALIGLWWLFVLLAVNPHWLGLPGTGALTNFALLIAAYIPAGVLLGAALGWLLEAADEGRRTKDSGVQDRRQETGDRRPEMRVRSSRVSGLLSPVSVIGGWRLALRAVAFVLLAALALWGAGQRLGDLDVAQHALVTRPDERAAAWIRANTPPDARFLVNAFFAYGGASAVGSDGGWWLPLLAGRQTTLPPILYGSEQPPRPDYRLWVNALPTLLQSKPVGDPEVLAMLRERGITHVYVGQLQGRVNYAGPAVLQPKQLLASSHFRVVYHEDRVWIFEVVQ